MGPCAGEGCDRQLYRGDIFFTPLSGGIYCLDCWEKAPGVDREMHRVISTAIHDVLAYGTSAVETYVEDGALHMRNVPTSFPEPDEKREQVWDGEFPS